MNVILNTQYHSDSLSLCLSPSHVVIGYVIYIHYIKRFQQNFLALLPSCESRKKCFQRFCVLPQV